MRKYINNVSSHKTGLFFTSICDNKNGKRFWSAESVPKRYKPNLSLTSLPVLYGGSAIHSLSNHSHVLNPCSVLKWNMHFHTTKSASYFSPTMNTLIPVRPTFPFTPPLRTKGKYKNRCAIFSLRGPSQRFRHFYQHLVHSPLSWPDAGLGL